jgi:hypothetical protein
MDVRGRFLNYHLIWYGVASVWLFAGTAVHSSNATTAAETTALPAKPDAADDARAAAEVILPLDIFIEQNKQSFVYSFDATTKDEPSAQALFAAYPGVREVLIDTQLAGLEAMLRSEHVTLLERFGNHFRVNYTPAELGIIRNFFSAPLGRKMIELEYSQVDDAQLLKALSNDDGGLTKAESDKLNAALPAKIYLALSPSERAVAMKYWMSPTGKKMKSNSPAVQDMVRDWLNGVSTKFETEAAETSARTVSKFIEEADKKRLSTDRKTEPGAS